MKTAADEAAKNGGGKNVEPQRPRESLFTRLARAPEFIAQVRQEGSKVTWPTIAETRVTTIAVFIMIAMSIVFFFAVDWVISTVVKYILGAV